MIFALLLAACSTDATCEAAQAAGPTLTIGTGELSWVDVADGDHLGWTFGSQGGMHVYGSLRATHLLQGASDSLSDPDNPMVDFVLLDGDITIAGFTRIPHHFTEAVDGTLSAVGDRLVLYEEDATYLDGLEVVMRATVDDRCGTQVTDERTVVLDADR